MSCCVCPVYWQHRFLALSWLQSGLQAGKSPGKGESNQHQHFEVSDSCQHSHCHQASCPMSPCMQDFELRHLAQVGNGLPADLRRLDRNMCQSAVLQSGGGVGCLAAAIIAASRLFRQLQGYWQQQSRKLFVAQRCQSACTLDFTEAMYYLPFCSTAVYICICLRDKHALICMQ